MIDVNKVEVTDEDRAVDVSAMLEESATAVAFLQARGVKVPEEATQFVAVLRRCVVAERMLDRLSAQRTG